MAKAATIRQDKQTGKYQAVFNGVILNRSFSREHLIRVIREGKSPKAIRMGVTDVIDNDTVTVSATAPLIMTNATAQLRKNDSFNINKRFTFVEQLTNMIIDKEIPSLIITGEGGLGKTYTVMKTLKDAGLTNTRDSMQKFVDIKAGEDAAAFVIEGDYCVVKGYSTARGLFRTLFENRERIVVFDDCDKILRDEVAVNILKSALDSYDERWITWNSEQSPNSDLPKSFLFTGQIIFISNLAQYKIDQAVRSRSMCVDLMMTTDQKIERMSHIIESANFLPKFTLDQKQDALEFIDTHKLEATEISLRTLISVTKIRANNKVGNWKELALYILTTSDDQ
ncbi:MAG: AAA family ATPase [Candidatus Nitrosotenuis sp.]